MYHTSPASRKQSKTKKSIEKSRPFQNNHPPAPSTESWIPGLWEVNVLKSSTKFFKTPKCDGRLPLLASLFPSTWASRNAYAGFNRRTWHALIFSKLLFFQRKSQARRQAHTESSSILVPLMHSVISVAYISFNKLPCDSCRAWRQDWFKIPALLKLHCSSSSWVIFMWSVKLPNK